MIEHMLSSDTFYLVMAIAATIAVPVLFIMNTVKEVQIQRGQKAESNGVK